MKKERQQVTRNIAKSGKVLNMELFYPVLILFRFDRESFAIRFMPYCHRWQQLGNNKDILE